ncbi:MAG: hypothetical protein J6X18_07355 [Bacteroidales bacterium]|nr:hypothetical protein [Bacteroidales bacterium]
MCTKEKLIVSLSQQLNALNETASNLNAVQIEESLVKVSYIVNSIMRVLHEIEKLERTPVVVPKPDEEKLRKFILNVLESGKSGKASPGWTLYDYAIGWIRDSVIPEPPQD